MSAAEWVLAERRRKFIRDMDFSETKPKFSLEEPSNGQQKNGNDMNGTVGTGSKVHPLNERQSNSFNTGERRRATIAAKTDAEDGQPSAQMNSIQNQLTMARHRLGELIRAKASRKETFRARKDTNMVEDPEMVGINEKNGNVFLHSSAKS